eukprot:12687487-Alexandrium_andersonii.AAC.1
MLRLTLVVQVSLAMQLCKRLRIGTGGRRLGLDRFPSHALLPGWAGKGSRPLAPPRHAIGSSCTEE